MEVKVDPKVIAARRQDGQKIQQNVSVKQNTRNDPQEWRKQHGLAPMRKQRD